MTKGWKTFWIVFDAMMFVFCFSVSVVMWDPKGYIFYYDGLYRTNLAFTRAFFLLPFIMTCICLAVAQLFIWRLGIGKKRIFGIVAAFLIPTFIVMLPAESPGYVRYTLGFHQRLKEQLQIEPVRQWLNSIDDSVLEASNWGLDSSDPAVPTEVQKAISGVGFCSLSFFRKDGFRCVKITTGSGGISRLFGVVIGPREMPVAQIEEASHDETGKPLKHKEYRIKLDDGAYVWHD